MSLRCKLFKHKGYKYACGKGNLTAEVFQCGRCDYVVTMYSESNPRSGSMSHLETVHEKPDFAWEWYQTTIWMR